jgi:hypothetical protein
MASLNEAFNLTVIPETPETTRPTYGYICRICGGCYNYHKTRAVQQRTPHEFVRGTYRELLPFEQYPFDEETGFSYVN